MSLSSSVEGDDLIFGKDGNDTLSDGIGNDWLYGDQGADTLTGGVGQDELWGGAGNDTLNGGADGDRLFGGEGNGTLIGGIGSDAFVFHPDFGTDIVTTFDDSTSENDVTEIASSIFSITLKNYDLANLGADDFRFT